MMLPTLPSADSISKTEDRVQTLGGSHSRIYMPVKADVLYLKVAQLLEQLCESRDERNFSELSKSSHFKRFL